MSLKERTDLPRPYSIGFQRFIRAIGQIADQASTSEGLRCTGEPVSVVTCSRHKARARTG